MNPYIHKIDIKPFHHSQLQILFCKGACLSSSPALPLRKVSNDLEFEILKFMKVLVSLEKK